jgi:hypothetical protein
MLAQQRLVSVGVFVLVASAAFALGGRIPFPAIAVAQSMPTCGTLATDPAYGLAANPTVVEHSVTLVTEVGGRGVPPHCQVDLYVSEREGPVYGYAPGEAQRVGIRVGLPVNTADGGSGGGPEGEGSWNGKVVNLGGGSAVGSLASVVGPAAAGYVGSFTDSGHTGAPLDGSWGVIQEARQLNEGKIRDFYSESLRLQYQWALQLANTYYGKPAARNYFSGCSTGGRQGMVLAQEHGEDFDGFLIGAPFIHQARTGSALMWRVWLALEMTGGAVPPAKSIPAISRMVAECDGQDGVIDGMLSDPGSCKASAEMNVCGMPGAPTDGTCLTETEARAIDLALDGPFNDQGHRVWYSNGRGAPEFQLGPLGERGTGFLDIFAWAHQDLNYDFRPLPLSQWDDVHERVTRTLGPLINLGSPDLDRTRNSGAKVLMWHGLADPAMPWPQNVRYYNQVIDHYQGLENVTPWFRFYLAPGVNHCGGGVGPQPQGLFDTLMNWAENGVAPDSIPSSGNGRTRPLCPYPQMAVYDGVGDPNAASSFSCGGNLRTKQALCDLLTVKYQEETGSRYESLGGVNGVSCGLVFPPMTSASLSPEKRRGWYTSPTVTLTAADQDKDMDRSEYRLDGSDAWVPYTGPFQVSDDGAHVLEYRSVDKGDNVEATQLLRFKSDATPPLISGMPAPSCTLWPANNKLVQVAAVTIADETSGLAPRSVSIRVTSNERLTPDDVLVKDGKVLLRAQRNPGGSGRVYTVNATAFDRAGNYTTASAACVVPRHRAE